MSAQNTASPSERGAGTRYSLSAMRALIWPLVSPHRGWLYIVAIATPLGMVGQMLKPILLQATIDGPLTQGDLGTLTTYCALFSAVVIGAFLFNSLGVFGLQLIGLRGLATLRRTLFGHVLGQGQAFYDQRTTGSLMTRTTNDVDAIGESLTRGVVGLISDALLIIGTLSVMCWLNPWLTLVSFSISPFLVWVVNSCRKQLRVLFTGIRQALSELNGLFAEYINGVNETQRYGAQAVAEERFDDLSAKFRDLYHRANWWDAGLYAVMDGLSALSVGLVIAYVAYYAAEWSGVGLIEGVSVGLLVAFIDALNRVYVPIREFSGRLASIQRAFAALDRILGLLNTQEMITAGERSLPEIKGEVRFHRVSFSYQTGGAKGSGDSEDIVELAETSKQVLREVSFEVSPGEVVALVGSTGSGKSTIARLLSRQYQGFSGEISLDGVSLDSLDLDTVHRAFVVVGQDPYLFRASISENIHLWDDKIAEDKARITSAARRACAHSFIDALPEGYQTQCASGGANLSAGQRQLITIARAFAREAPIVILDEATASVDALTERLIDEATSQLFKERTVLVIAHRLSTITKADRILMLERGEVVEQGTHAELLALQGAYSKLVQTELQSQESLQSDL